MTPKPLLIRGGTLVNSDYARKADVLIDNGKITAVGLSLPAHLTENARVLDASGKLVLPGGIDSHTHLQLPFMHTRCADDWASGTRAALCGGTTTTYLVHLSTVHFHVIDFVYPTKGQSLLDVYSQWQQWANDGAVCNYGFSVVVPEWNDTVKHQMSVLVGDKGARARIHAENGLVIDVKERQLKREGYSLPNGHLITRDEELSGEAARTACLIAAQTKCTICVTHVHSDTLAQAVVDAKRNVRVGPIFGSASISYYSLTPVSFGTNVLGEPTISALVKSGTEYSNPDWHWAAAHILTPPLSDRPNNQTKLIKRLANELDFVGSDHASYMKQCRLYGKDDFTKIPHGVNGIEERMMLVWNQAVRTSIMSPERFIAVTSTNAAKFFNIFPQKGHIAVGSDADVVIWDSNAEHTISQASQHHAADINIYEGIECWGVPVTTIVNGKIVWQDGQLNVDGDEGRWLQLPKF